MYPGKLALHRFAIWSGTQDNAKPMQKMQNKKGGEGRCITNSDSETIVDIKHDTILVPNVTGAQFEDNIPVVYCA